MRAKFGEGALGGLGSEPQASGDLGFDAGAAAGAAADATKAAAGAVTSAVTGGIGFLKSNVIENAELHTKVKSTTAGAVEGIKGTAAGVTEKASGIWSSLSQQAQSGELVGTLKKNATGEEGTMVHKAAGWGFGAAKNLGESQRNSW